MWSRPETRFGVWMWAAALAAAIGLGIFIQSTRAPITPSTTQGVSPPHASMTPYQTGLAVVVLVMGVLGAMSLFIGASKAIMTRQNPAHAPRKRGVSPHFGAFPFDHVPHDDGRHG
ncbi:MAG: hypothetical protein IPK69_04350 [Phycisphaerales bacterium]|nr:MAG: hypothetical protein IPK69_04350 [Phycisphaerales bacterium]